MRWSTSATSTDAELSIARRMSVMVSVTLGDVPAACHNARSASASSGRHSRIKKGPEWSFALSAKSIYVLWGSWRPHLPQLGKRGVIRRANSSCCGDFCRLLRFRVPLPADAARRERVDSPHFQVPTLVRRHRLERLPRFGASCLGHCHQ